MRVQECVGVYVYARVCVRLCVFVCMRVLVRALMFMYSKCKTVLLGSLLNNRERTFTHFILI